jgi:hypothetical protein
VAILAGWIDSEHLTKRHILNAFAALLFSKLIDLPTGSLSY